MTAIGIAAGSLFVAFLSLAWSITQGIRASRALSREEARREEEVTLLRRQIDTAAESRSSEGAAILTAYERGGNVRPEHVSQTFHIRNIGRAGARDVVAWIALRAPGVEPGDGPPASFRAALGALAPNDPPQGFTLTQDGPFPGGQVPREADLVASWIDVNGHHVGSVCQTTWWV